jgi:hypothetical protein
MARKASTPSQPESQQGDQIGQTFKLWAIF